MLYGGAPPASLNVNEYTAPSSPAVIAATVNSLAGATTCIGDTRYVNAWSAEFALFVLSVPRNVNAYPPGAVGEPATNISLPSGTRPTPGGKPPLTSDHEYVELPLVARKSDRSAAPTQASGGLPLVMRNPDALLTTRALVLENVCPAVSRTRMRKP